MNIFRCMETNMGNALIALHYYYVQYKIWKETCMINSLLIKSSYDWEKSIYTVGNHTMIKFACRLVFHLFKQLWKKIKYRQKKPRTIGDWSNLLMKDPIYTIFSHLKSNIVN